METLVTIEPIMETIFSYCSRISWFRIAQTNRWMQNLLYKNSYFLFYDLQLATSRVPFKSFPTKEFFERHSKTRDQFFLTNSTPIFIRLHRYIESGNYLSEVEQENFLFILRHCLEWYYISGIHSFIPFFQKEAKRLQELYYSFVENPNWAEEVAEPLIRSQSKSFPSHLKFVSPIFLQQFSSHFFKTSNSAVVNYFVTHSCNLSWTLLVNCNSMFETKEEALYLIKHFGNLDYSEFMKYLPTLFSNLKQWINTDLLFAQKIIDYNPSFVNKCSVEVLKQLELKSNTLSYMFEQYPFAKWKQVYNKENKLMNSMVVKKEPRLALFLFKELQENSEFILQNVKRDVSILSYVSSDLLENDSFVEELFDSNPFAEIYLHLLESTPFTQLIKICSGDFYLPKTNRNIVRSLSFDIEFVKKLMQEHPLWYSLVQGSLAKEEQLVSLLAKMGRAELASSVIRKSYTTYLHSLLNSEKPFLHLLPKVFYIENPEHIIVEGVEREFEHFRYIFVFSNLVETLFVEQLKNQFLVLDQCHVEALWNYPNIIKAILSHPNRIFYNQGSSLQKIVQRCSQDKTVTQFLMEMDAPLIRYTI